MGNYATKTELSAQVDATNAELSAQVDAINARLSEIESLTLIQQPLKRAACIKTTAMPALASIDESGLYSKGRIALAICPCYFDDDEESCTVGGMMDTQLCSGDELDDECRAWETYMRSVMKEYAKRPEASKSARELASSI